MILEWRSAPPIDLKLEWIGPSIFTTMVAREPELLNTVIAVIIGPKGDDGPTGPKGEKGDAAVYDEALPLVLDLGNF